MKIFGLYFKIYALKNERITKSINQLKSHCEKVTPATQLKKFVVPWVKLKSI